LKACRGAGPGNERWLADIASKEERKGCEAFWGRVGFNDQYMYMLMN
jgi:hypothetical protein